MKTISLRYAENFSPSCGTIKAHQQLIDANGFVWMVWKNELTFKSKSN